MRNLDKNKKVAVLGMGIEGLALVDFLMDKGCKISVLDKLNEENIKERLSDSEKVKFEQIMLNDDIEKVFSDYHMDNLKDYDLVFRSPGISYLNPKIQEAKNAGVEISSQIKLFFDLCPCKIIGVTGTKGKGTTASLIYEILRKQSASQQVSKSAAKSQTYLAGNIGYPAITLIPDLNPEDIVILELSSFQLMGLDKSPQIAVVTNLSVDHLDYHKDIEEYRSSKENIVKFQAKNELAILNSKSTFSQSVIDSVPSDIKYFSSSESGDAIVINDSVVLDPKGRNIKICDKDNIELFGNHNLENIAAAVLVADSLGVDIETIKTVVTKFKGLPHRIEFVAEIDGISFVNDSFATNPEPTIAAIRSFSEDKILILGGSSKGADFSVLAQEITSSNVKLIILIGAEGDKIESALLNYKYQGILKKVAGLDEVVRAALTQAIKGDVVVFSPACASFDMFKNYKDRGDKFKTAVLKLLNHES